MNHPINILSKEICDYFSDYFSVPSNKDLKENPEAIIGYKFVGDNPVKKDQKTFYKN